MADEQPLEGEKSPEGEEEQKPLSETSTEETVKTGEEEPVEEEPKIPLSRLREERQKREKLEAELSDLRSKKDEVSRNLTPDKEMEAKNYLKQLIKETTAELDAQKKAEEAAQDKVFNATLGEVKEVYPDVVKNEKEFLKFVEEGNFEDSVDGLWGAAKVFKKFKETSKASSTPKPKMPSGSKTSDKVETPPVDIKSKSLYQILEDAKNEFKEK